jgi:hypothetical protein
MPLATAVLSGDRAAEGFDLPLLARIRSGVSTPGLVCVGAGQRRAWDPRASLARPQDGDWSPLPWPGATAAALDAGRTTGVTQGERGERARRERTKDRGHQGLVAAG